MTARSAIVDYGMGNRRSVEKALERVGAAGRADRRPRRAARRRRAGRARRRRLPGGDGALRELGLDELVVGARRRGRRCSACASGCSCSSSARASSAATTGSGCCPARSSRSSRAALKVPHIGWNVVTLHALVAAARGPCRAARPSTTCIRSWRGPRRGRRARPRRLRRAVRLDRRRGDVYGVQFHPEKSSTARPGAAANFTSRLRAGQPE